jgi:hypothetical protein
MAYQNHARRGSVLVTRPSLITAPRHTWRRIFFNSGASLSQRHRTDRDPVRLPVPGNVSPSRRSTAALRILVWAALIFVGLRGLPARFASQVHPVAGPFASSDTWLTSLRVDSPSKRVLELINEAPEESPVLLVGRSNDPTLLATFFGIGYLAWPHKMVRLECDYRTGISSIEPDIDDSRVGEIIFYDISPPPWLVHIQGLGENLSVDVPASFPQGTPWSRLCS